VLSSDSLFLSRWVPAARRQDALVVFLVRLDEFLGAFTLVALGPRLLVLAEPAV
jgi:hypothetical protein